MAVTSHVYAKAQQSLGNKLANLGTDSLKVMLLSAYTVGTTQQTAQYLSDVLTAGVGTEATGTGYTAGGQALTSVTLSTSGLVTTLTCANPSWASSTITAAFAVFYDSTPGTNATDPVLCYWDFGGNVSSTSGPFTLTINASGLITFTAS